MKIIQGYFLKLEGLELVKKGQGTADEILEDYI